MKIIIDPVYTGVPSTCSTSYLAWEIIDELIKWRDDIYFYVLYPTKVKDDPIQMAFLDKHKDRVKLIEYPYVTGDRMYELVHYAKELWELMAGHAQLWDADMILTSRIPQIPMMRLTTGRQVTFGKGSFRSIVGLEEMPIFSFRDTVPWADGNYDLGSLNNYLMADAMIVNNLWTKRKVLQLARSWLAPGKQKNLREVIKEAVPVPLQPLAKNKKKFKTGDEFNAVFCGRVTGTRNFKQVIEVFANSWAHQIGEWKKGLRVIVSTQSKSMGASSYGDVSFLEWQNNNREQFHDLVENKAHVIVNLSTVEDFSLSTYEPLTKGVPVIVPDKEWTSFLGKDYPFRVKNTQEAVGMLNYFMKHYDKAYELFEEWHKSYWLPFIETEANTTTAEHMKAIIENHEARTEEKLTTGKPYGGVLRDIADRIAGQKLETVDVKQYIRDNEASIWHEKLLGIPLSRTPNWLLVNIFLRYRGYQDTNETGVMRYVGEQN